VGASRETERDVKAVVPHREVRVVSRAHGGFEPGHGDRCDERQEQRAAVAAVGVCNADPQIGVTGQREAAPCVAEEGAGRERGLPRVDVADQKAGAGGDGQRPGTDDVAGIDAGVVIGAIASEERVLEAEARRAFDPRYARVGMDQPQGQARRRAEPYIRRERQGARELALREVDFGGDYGANLILLEDKRISMRGRAHESDEQSRTTHDRTVTRALALTALVAAGGCTADLASFDSAYYNWDGRKVHCTVEGDTKAGNDLASIGRGLDRAVERGEVLEILVHQPGVSMSWEDFDALLAAVNERGLAWVTYEDMAHGIDPVGGVSLQYDGTYLGSWMESREYLLKHNARATIFVTRYHRLDEGERAILRQLSDDGNDIEPHSVNHLRGPVVVEEEGLNFYLETEVQPSIDILRADGYEIVSFAYPFGDRTDEIDEAVTKRVPIVRSLAISRALVTSPCPY